MNRTRSAQKFQKGGNSSKVKTLSKKKKKSATGGRGGGRRKLFFSQLPGVSKGCTRAKTNVFT